MKISSLIPLRGGSKGVPGKNIKIINGNPLCFYAIESSNKSNLIQNTYISTDDSNIEKVCSQYNVIIHRRDPKCGQDNSTFNSVVKDFLDKNNNIDILVYIQATNPHILSTDLDKALKKFIDGDFNLIMGVVKCHSFIWRKIDEKYIKCINEKIRTRQKAIEEFEEDGSYYIFRTKDFIDNNYQFSKDKIGYNVNSFGIHQEIDEPIDFEIARLIKENNL